MVAINRDDITIFGTYSEQMLHDSLSFHLSKPDAAEALPKESRLRFGQAAADEWLNGGLKADGLHEFYAATPEDAASTTSFALLIAQVKYAAEHRPILWVREKPKSSQSDMPYGPGLLHLGLDPDGVILLTLPDAKAVLRAGLDSVRYGTAAVLIELTARQPLLDLTTTRRLALAAADLGVLVLISRSGADPNPSAAHTRWQIASAPSARLEANAPGHPAFDLTLLKHRGGRDGLRLVLEWNRDTASFRERDMLAEPEALPCPLPTMAGSGTGDRDRHRAA